MEGHSSREVGTAMSETTQTKIDKVLNLAKHACKGSYSIYELYKQELETIPEITPEEYQNAIRSLARILRV